MGTQAAVEEFRIFVGSSVARKKEVTSLWNRSHSVASVLHRFQEVGGQLVSASMFAQKGLNKRSRLYLPLTCKADYLQKLTFLVEQALLWPANTDLPMSLEISFQF